MYRGLCSKWRGSGKIEEEDLDECVHGHQNPDKLNNFFKQNVFNEKLNITKNPFTWHLEDPYRAQLFNISPINLNDGLYSRSEEFARTLQCSMPTNAA